MVTEFGQRVLASEVQLMLNRPWAHRASLRKSAYCVGQLVGDNEEHGDLDISTIVETLVTAAVNAWHLHLLDARKDALQGIKRGLYHPRRNRPWSAHVIAEQEKAKLAFVHRMEKLYGAGVYA